MGKDQHNVEYLVINECVMVDESHFAACSQQRHDLLDEASHYYLAINNAIWKCQFAPTALGESRFCYEASHLRVLPLSRYHLQALVLLSWSIQQGRMWLE